MVTPKFLVLVFKVRVLAGQFSFFCRRLTERMDLRIVFFGDADETYDLLHEMAGE